MITYLHKNVNIRHARIKTKNNMRQYIGGQIYLTMKV